MITPNEIVNGTRVLWRCDRQLVPAVINGVTEYPDGRFMVFLKIEPRHKPADLFLPKLGEGAYRVDAWMKDIEVYDGGIWMPARTQSTPPRPSPFLKGKNGEGEKKAVSDVG